MKLPSGLSRAEVISRERAHVWPPYTSSERHEQKEPLVIVEAEGPFIIDADGRRIRPPTTDGRHFPGAAHNDRSGSVTGNRPGRMRPNRSITVSRSMPAERRHARRIALYSSTRVMAMLKLVTTF